MVRAPDKRDIASILRSSAEAGPSRLLLTFTETGERLTYGALDANVNRFAHGLIRLGVAHGTFVNLILPNCPQFLIATYALRRIGAVEVAVNAEARGDALVHMLGVAPGAGIIIHASLIPMLAQIIARVVRPAFVIVAGEVGTDTAAVLGDSLAFDAILAAESEHYPDMNVNPLDIAMVIFTSGTTGPPKGCLLSHRQLVRSAECIIEALDTKPDDCMYTGYPLFHGRASNLDVFSTIMAGGRIVLAPRISISRFWNHMREHEVTLFSIIGTMMQLLWKHPTSPEERNHNVRLTWGGPITVPPADFEARFGVPVLPGDGVFGMSETGMLNMSSFDPDKSGRIRSIYEVCIADDDDNPLPRGEVGEILVRGKEPGVMFMGYANMPDATVAACRNLWFHTGDLGKMDAEGRMTFVGRKKERLRVGGHNISSWEIETVLDRHPDVFESAVIGVPSELGEEDVKAYVVLQKGSSLSAEMLDAYCRENMARFMVPRHIEFLSELPKTQSGKPAKVRLVELHRSKRAAETKGS